MSSFSIGIDFGTTNTVVALAGPDGPAELVRFPAAVTLFHMSVTRVTRVTAGPGSASPFPRSASPADAPVTDEELAAIREAASRDHVARH